MRKMLAIVLFVLVSSVVFAQVQLSAPRVSRINPAVIVSDPGSDLSAEVHISGSGLLGHTDVKVGGLTVQVLENNNPNNLKVVVVIPKDSTGDYPISVGPVTTGLNLSVKNQAQVQAEEEETAKEAIRSGAASGSLANGRVVGVIKAIFQQAYPGQVDSYWAQYRVASRAGADALVAEALRKIASQMPEVSNVDVLSADDIANIVNETMTAKFQEAENRMIQYTDQTVMGLKDQLDGLRGDIELNRQAARLALEGVVELDAKTKKASEKDQRKPEKRPLDPATKDRLRTMLGKLAQKSQ